MQRNSLLTGTITTSLLLLNTTLGKAQIIPDRTLPQNTIVRREGNTTVISGGTQQGRNLFHSFMNFSVPTNSTTLFNNSLDVQNIIARVTGNSASIINGIIQDNGKANLFFINPNGILFGQNANLNIGGSFLGTTADEINFVDGIFSTQHPDNGTLLSINIPIGLKFSGNNGDIQITGSGTLINNINTLGILNVKNKINNSISSGNGKNLAFIGGNINVVGATIKAEDNLELASIALGEVKINSINSQWNFNYESVNNFKDITLSNNALIYSSSEIPSGYINIQARNINVTNSAILIQNLGNKPSGDITINTSGNLTLISDGSRDFSTLRTETAGNGDGGNIYISARNLNIKQGGGINSETYSAGNAGDIIINALNSTTLLGDTIPNQLYQSSISNNSFGAGDAGNILLNTTILNAEGGAVIQSGALNTGASGNVTVDADSINLTGEYISSPIDFSSTAIGSTNFNYGNAGTVAINTKILTLEQGADINTSTLGSSNAGRIIINASDSINVNGFNSKSGDYSNISSSAIISPIIQKLFGSSATTSGNSGDITLNTNSLNLTQGGRINVINEGSGNAGEIAIKADSINISNQGLISASTKSGEGGNIFIKSKDVNITHEGGIITNAGNTGNSGNITINTNTLAVLANSSITANAFEGEGGNILINTQGFFLSSDSQITASSQKGINGTVQIYDDKVSLANITLPPLSIKQATNVDFCGQKGSINNKLNMTGKGGIAQSPNDALSSFTLWTDNTNTSKLISPDSQDNIQPNKLVEAQGWKTNPDGTISFTTPNQANVQNTRVNPACQLQEYQAKLE